MEVSGKRITVGIFDDHPIVLDGVSRSLQAHADTFEVLFTASDTDGLLKNYEKFLPQILILDIISSDVKALELFEYFQLRYPEVLIVANTSLGSPILVQNLLYLGVKGFVNKRQSFDDLLQTLILVSEGHISVPSDYKYLTTQYQITQVALLSRREIEIVNLIAKEYNSQQIAEILHISVNTVENHRKRIFLKLNVKNVAGMVRVATSLAYISE